MQQLLTLKNYYKCCYMGGKINSIFFQTYIVIVDKHNNINS